MVKEMTFPEFITTLNDAIQTDHAAFAWIDKGEPDVIVYDETTNSYMSIKKIDIENGRIRVVV